MTKRELDDLGFGVMCQMVANDIARDHPGVLAMEEWERNPKRMWRITLASLGISVASCALICWAILQ